MDFSFYPDDLNFSSVEQLPSARLLHLPH